MDKDSLPNRDILRRIVVEVGDNTGKNETRRVTDNTPQLNLVRRPGEGSRPLFDRDEIINRRRIIGEQDGRFADRSQNEILDFGDRLRSDNDIYRRSGISRRLGSESFRDDPFLSCTGRCPTCHSNWGYLTECGEGCVEGRQRRVFRTLSDDRLTRDHSHGHRYYIPAEMESFYIYHDPHYYGVWNNSMSHSLYDYNYFSN